MSALTLKAHFDGQHITLDEPYDLPPGTPLTVTVLSTSALLDPERAEWMSTASASLAAAYGDDEPQYTLADLKP